MNTYYLHKFRLNKGSHIVMLLFNKKKFPLRTEIKRWLDVLISLSIISCFCINFSLDSRYQLLQENFLVLSRKKRIKTKTLLMTWLSADTFLETKTCLNYKYRQDKHRKRMLHLLFTTQNKNKQHKSKALR